VKNNNLHTDWQDQSDNKIELPYSVSPNYFDTLADAILLQAKLETLPKENVYNQPADYINTFTVNTAILQPAKKTWALPKIAIAASVAMLIAVGSYFISTTPNYTTTIAQIVDENQIKDADAEAYLLDDAEDDIVKTNTNNATINLENITIEEINNYLIQEEI
jgi:hypothetical protein